MNVPILQIVDITILKEVRKPNLGKQDFIYTIYTLKTKIHKYYSQ